MVNEHFAHVQCARCPKCPGWVVLSRGRCKSVSPDVDETECARETCRTTFQVHVLETRFWKLPHSIIERGYFYEHEVENL